MAPPLLHATFAADVPVYALVFAGDDHVVFVGGGGAGRSGVANVIKAASLPIDPEKPSLRPAGELKLSSQEDAPMCLAIHPSHPHLVCGINAAADQMSTGPNQHVRLFEYQIQDMVDPTEETEATPGLMSIQPTSSYESLGLSNPDHYQKTATFSPDGKFLAVASTNGLVQLHRYPSMETVFSTHVGVLSLDEEIYDTDFSHDSRQLAITTANRLLILSTAPKTTDGDTPTFSPRILQTIEQPKVGSGKGQFRMAKFGRGPLLHSSSKHALYTLINDESVPGSKARRSYVAMWDVDTWTVKKIRTVSQRPATVLAVSPNGRLVAVGASDMTLSVYRASTLQFLCKADKVHDFPPTCLAFSPNSRMLVSGSADSSVRVTVLPTHLLPRHVISDESIFVVFCILLVLAAMIIPSYLQD